MNRQKFQYMAKQIEAIHFTSPEFIKQCNALGKNGWVLLKVEAWTNPAEIKMDCLFARAKTQ